MFSVGFFVAFVAAAAAARVLPFKINMHFDAPNIDTHFQLVSCTVRNFDTAHVPSVLLQGTHVFHGDVVIVNKTIGGHSLEVFDTLVDCAYRLARDHAVVFKFGFESECVVDGFCTSASYKLAQPDRYGAWTWSLNALNRGFAGDVKLIGSD
jgi:hypothetical protein